MNQFNVYRIITLTMSSILYLIYNVIGIVYLTEFPLYNSIWFYSLFSILLIPLFFLLSSIGRNFIYYKYLIFTFLVSLWGIIVVSNVNYSYNNLVYFAITSIIFQLLLSFFPIIVRIYTFLCSIKTPCCCIDNEQYYEHKSTDNEIAKEHTEIIINTLD